MSTTILDDTFDEAALTEITAHTPNIGGAYTVRDSSGGGANGLRIAAGAGYAYAYNGQSMVSNAAALSSTEWDCTVEFDRVGSGAFPIFRIGSQFTSTGAGYFARLNHYADKVELFKTTNWITLGTAVAESSFTLPSTTTTVLLQKRGAVIKVFVNGTERISYTDSSPLTAGTLTGFGLVGNGTSDGRILRATTTQEDGGGGGSKLPLKLQLLTGA